MKRTKEIHTICLKLNMTNEQKQLATKRFHAITYLHNRVVSHVQALLHILDHDTAYQSALTEYKTILKAYKNTKKIPPDIKHKKTELSNQMTDIRKTIGLTEYSLQSYIKSCRNRDFKHLVSSTQLQKEVTHIFNGVQKVLFQDGKQVHFKPYRNMNTITGKTPTDGVRFDKQTMTINWLGMELSCKVPKNNRQYLYEALNHDICYYSIKRLMFNNGWHYYVIITLKGKPPKKLTVSLPNESVGIDPGTSSVAAVSDHSVYLTELAPNAKHYNQKIQRLQRKMDRSRKINNPEKYNPDGTINKQNHEKWKNSKTYCKLRDQLKTLYRKKSAYTKQSHEILCNRILTMGKHIITESMEFKGLMKRAKQTGKQEKQSVITNKKGETKVIHKFKRKKRFGRSMNNRSPALFLTILKRKALLYGGSYTEVNTREYKASQYNHVTDEYVNCPLCKPNGLHKNNSLINIKLSGI